MRFDDLERALDALGERIAELAQSAADNPPGRRLRRYEPKDQVLARVELSGRQRRLANVHAGVDVHGDGSTVAYLGRIRRTALEPGADEDAAAALRRALVES